jgi:hypothetical protein
MAKERNGWLIMGIEIYMLKEWLRRKRWVAEKER